MKLTQHQNAIIQSAFDRKISLEGPAGTGKMTASVALCHNLRHPL